MIRRPPKPTLFPSTTLSRPLVYGSPGTAGSEIRNRITQVDNREYPKYLRDSHAEEAFGDHQLDGDPRSEEHTSELQSPCNLVCRLLLEKKTQRPASFIPFYI